MTDGSGTSKTSKTLWRWTMRCGRPHASVSVHLNSVPAVFTPVTNPQINLGDSASHNSDFPQPFMAMNNLSWPTGGLPERQKGNSLGQRPRKTRCDSFQPEGLAQPSHTFSVLANQRGRFFLGRCPRLFPGSPSGCFTASRWQVKSFIAINGFPPYGSKPLKRFSHHKGRL